MKNVGKTSMKVKYKKDETGCDVEKFIEIIGRKDLEVVASYENEGKTDEGYEFATIKFYMKKK